MKDLYRNSQPIKSNKIFLRIDRPSGGGPEFSNDPLRPPEGLIQAGQEHDKIVSDENRAVIVLNCSIGEVSHLVDECLKGALSINPERVIERLVAETINPGQFAPIAITDRDHLSEALNQDPANIVKQVIARIKETTGMGEHFVGITVAHQLSLKLT